MTRLLSSMQHQQEGDVLPKNKVIADLVEKQPTTLNQELRDRIQNSYHLPTTTIIDSPVANSSSLGLSMSSNQTTSTTSTASSAHELSSKPLSPHGPAHSDTSTHTTDLLRPALRFQLSRATESLPQRLGGERFNEDLDYSRLKGKSGAASSAGSSTASSQQTSLEIFLSNIASESSRRRRKKYKHSRRTMLTFPTDVHIGEQNVETYM